MSDFPNETLKDLAPAYALGILEGEELAAFERALAIDPALVREVAEFRETAGLLGETLEPIAPPASLRARVLATTPAGPSARETDVLPFTPKAVPLPVPAKPRSNAAWWGAMAASVALLAAGAYQLRQVQSELAAVGAVAERSARTADSLAARLAARERTLQALLAPDVQLVRLAPGSEAPAGVQLFINPATRKVVIFAANLPRAGTGKTYQLWFIRNGQAPIPSVTFDTGDDGTGLIESIDVPEGDLPALAAITIEPQGGSTSPTMPIVLSGALTR